MSSILKKEDADKMVFKHNPKSFRVEHSTVAKTFVKTQDETSSSFKVAEVVAQLSGIETMRKENIEKQVEGTVLERLKEIQEQAYKQAYNLGLHEGGEKAFEEKREEFVQRLKQLDQALLEIEHLKEQLLKESESALMKIVYQLATKIARREIAMDQGPVVELLNQLVAELQSADNISVKLSPQDYQFIEGLRQKNVKEVEKLARVKLYSLDEISPGGCLIETNHGEIDATIEERVNKAWAIVEAKLPRIKAS